MRALSLFTLTAAGLAAPVAAFAHDGDHSETVSALFHFMLRADHLLIGVLGAVACAGLVTFVRGGARKSEQ